MRQLFRVVALAAAAAGILVFPLAAGAGHATDPHTPDLVPRGHILEPASLLNPAIGNPDILGQVRDSGELGRVQHPGHQGPGQPEAGRTGLL